MNNGINLFIEASKNTLKTYLNKSDALSCVGRGDRLPQIEYFFWEVNDYCNSRCHSCNIWQRPANDDYLKLVDIKNIFSEYDFSGVKSVIVSGGEPNLHPELAECLIEMGRYFDPNCVFNYSTNGLNPSRVLTDIEKLMNANLNVIVGISLDGVGDSHDESRGVKGNFKKVERLIELLKEYLAKLPENKRKKLDICVGSTLTPQTAPALMDVKRYCDENNLTFAAQMYEEFSYYSSYDKTDINSKLNDDKRFGNSINESSIEKDSYADYELLKSNGDREIMLKAIGILPRNLQYEILYKSITDKPIGFKCGAMTKFFLLHSNGDVSPCLKYSHIRTGNVKDQGFKNVWFSSKSSDSRKKVGNCVGCSNTWATSWSLRHWIISFMPLIIKSKIGRLIKN